MKPEQINIQELKLERKKNFEERIWFIKYWANYIKSHSDEDWSKGQAVLIDSQIKNAENISKEDYLKLKG